MISGGLILKESQQILLDEVKFLGLVVHEGADRKGLCLEYMDDDDDDVKEEPTSSSTSSSSSAIIINNFAPKDLLPLPLILLTTSFKSTATQLPSSSILVNSRGMLFDHTPAAARYVR